MNRKTMGMMLGLLAGVPAVTLADGVTIPDDYASAPLASDTAYAFAKDCTPSLHEDQFKSMTADFKPGMVTVNSPMEKTKPSLVVANGKVICVYKTESGNPILPLSVFDKTIEFPGLPADEAHRLHVDLAQQLAKSGFATATVETGAGTAYQVVYLLASDKPMKIYYRLNFLKKGGFVEGGEHGFKGANTVSTTGRGTPAELYKGLYF